MTALKTKPGSDATSAQQESTSKARVDAMEELEDGYDL